MAGLSPRGDLDYNRRACFWHLPLGRAYALVAGALLFITDWLCELRLNVRTRFAFFFECGPGVVPSNWKAKERLLGGTSGGEPVPVRVPWRAQGKNNGIQSCTKGWRKAIQ